MRCRDPHVLARSTAMTSPDNHPATPDPRSLWIGTYDGGGGAGLSPLRLTANSLIAGIAYDGAHNAAFGVYSSRFDLHYLVDEQDDGALGVHRRTESGWFCLAHVGSRGSAPCHVALDHTQSCVAVANYASGSVAVYRLDPASGLPVELPMVHVNIGSGPNVERQQSAHAHWVGFGLDNKWLYATDLGTDAVLAFPFDADLGTVDTPVAAFSATPGSGPRHMLFHGRHRKVAYLACELDSTLVVLDVVDGTLCRRAALSTLPTGWQGANILAHIAANAAGDRLYVSNRGHDSIAVFALDDDGNPHLIQHVASGGASPRVVLLLEHMRWMVVVHERDHRVTILDILPDGTLAPTDIAVHIPGAAFAFVS
jgi:6-phosphogluconolactonase (cycloisomerase 2 family)